MSEVSLVLVIMTAANSSSIVATSMIDTVMKTSHFFQQRVNFILFPAIKPEAILHFIFFYINNIS